MATRPEFSDEEELLIQYIRSTSSTGKSTFYVATYLLLGCALVAYGLWNQLLVCVIAGWIVFVFARLQELGQEKKWSVVWRSVIEKYEAALAQDADDDT